MSDIDDLMSKVAKKTGFIYSGSSEGDDDIKGHVHDETFRYETDCIDLFERF